MMGADTVIRTACEEDLPEVLTLMRQLAEFEGYASSFKVTWQELKQRLIVNHDFEVLVAELENRVAGILVFYTLPFTFDLQPWFYIKELVVKPEYQSRGVGRALMGRLTDLASQRSVTKIRWEVLSDNLAAQNFYSALGAQHNSQWQLFSLDVKP